MTEESRRLFHCKMEELPIVAEFLLSSLEKDLTDFQAYSPKVFTPHYLESLRTKIKACKEVESTSLLTNQLKNVTKELVTASQMFRLKLNILEGYVKLSSKELDVPVPNFGIKKVRKEITRGNTEGFIAQMRTLIKAAKRNLSALEDKGFNPVILPEIESQIEEIVAINLKQNDLMNARNQLTEANIQMFNDLWMSMQSIFDGAKALYKGLNPVKLRAYTFSRLKQRVNAEKSKDKEMNNE